MILLLAILSATSAAASPPQAKVEQSARARASITILRAHRASQAGWDPAVHPNQREILKKEPGGAEVRLRLTEFE